MKQVKKKIFVDLWVVYKTRFIEPMLNFFGFGFLSWVNGLEAYFKNTLNIFTKHTNKNNVTYNSVIYTNIIIYL